MKTDIIYKKLNNYQIWYSLVRWWLITSIKRWDRELLYLDLDTFYDLSKNVRWWIPILFPNVWPLRDNNKCNLYQHWFARNSEFKLIEQDKNKVSIWFKSSKHTLDKYNYNFEFYLEVKEIDDKIVITQIIKNIWDKPMPISSGFHPYFYIPNLTKRDIKFSFSDENYYDIWSIWETKELKNPWIFQVDFWKYTLDFDYNKIFKYIWLWSESQKDFICIEPIYELENGLLDNPYMIEVGDEIKIGMSIR